jgi:diacylglycerol O-acyltransferase
MKLHHCLTDGVGLVRMTNGMIERGREPDPTSEAKPMPALPEIHYMSMAERFLDALEFERKKQTGRVRRAWNALSGQLDELVRHPGEAARGLTAALGSAGRLLAPVSEPMSPIMRERSSRWRFDTLTVDFQALKRAARAAGGTLNDAFVAGVCGGMRLYHEAHDRPVETLRMAMPINLRNTETEQKAGNHFAPVRFLVPVGVVDPLARMRAVHELVSEQRAEPALPIVEELSSLLNRLPARLTTALFGSMVKAVDFFTSNVPGPPFDVFVSGARLESIFGFGPLGGSAVNVTLFSYRGQLEIAVNTDRAAVPDPETFVRCLSRGMDEVLATGA